MRVLHLVNSMAHTGSGITNVAVDLMWAQVDAGYDVHVATCDGDFLPMLREHGVTVHSLDMTAKRVDLRIAETVRLRRVSSSVRPDVVHAHMIAPTVLARFSSGRPVVATVHNEFQRGVGLMGVAHHVVGVSNAVTAAMRRRGIPLRKLSTVRNGVVGSPRRSSGDHALEETPPGRKIMALGAVSHRKGADVLLEAMESVVQRVPDAHLYFIGNLDWQELSQRAASLAISDRVHFCGYREHPDSLLRQCEVFVLPSRRDPYPLALLEAMDLGLPIVASRTDGIPEALDNGESGMLVSVGDSTGLADAIVTLLRDPDLASRYAARAKTRATDFTIARMQQGYHRVYNLVRG